MSKRKKDKFVWKDGDVKVRPIGGNRTKRAVERIRDEKQIRV